MAVFSPVESSFDKVYYISPSGSNDGDGSLSQPFATLEKALDASKDGDGIKFLAGAYHLSPIYTTKYRSVGIRDKGKALTIWGEGPDTILEFYGEDVPSSKSRGTQLITLQNASSVVADLILHYYPNRSANYDNAIFGWCRGKTYNCLIENKGNKKTSVSYFNDNPANTPVVSNCIFKFNGKITSSYSGRPLFVNCLFDSSPLGGKQQSCIIRAYQDSDIGIDNLTSDLVNTGDPTVLNPDGTKSNIGACGGLYAWGYSHDIPPVEVDTLDLHIVLEVDEQIQLIGNIVPANLGDPNLVWSSSVPSVASVDATGNVTANEEGYTIISVKTVDETWSGFARVKVVAKGEGAKYRLSILLRLNENCLLESVFKPEGMLEEVIWTSGTPAVVTVDPSDTSTTMVSAQSKGLSLVTVQTTDGSKIDQIYVTVIE